MSPIDHDPHYEIADMIDGDSSFDAFAPHPADQGVPEEWQGGDDGEFKIEISEAERSEISEATILYCADQPLNDTGNGKRLLRHFGEELLHVREIGWHGWTGKRWRREGGDEIATYCAQRVAARISLEADFLTHTPYEADAIKAAEDAEIAIAALKAKKEHTDSEKKEIARLERVIAGGAYAREALEKRQTKRRAFAVSSGNSSRIKAMIEQALPHRTIPPEKLDADPYKLATENGVLRFYRHRELDLDCPDPEVERYKEEWRVELLPHDRNDYITKAAPVEYDAKATCDRFMAFLDRFQPDLAIRGFLQAYHGYALTGLCGEQVLIFNYGLGANGKSTFTDIVSQIMGDYSQTLPFESLAGDGNGRRGDQATPDIARLPGARLVRASEPDGDVRLKEGLIKSLTGGEPMLVRHLHKGFFEFRPEFKLTLSGNKKPIIQGVDHGIWRRIRLVPWQHTISESEKRKIEDVLAEFWLERAGILNWLVAGALRYLNEGLKAPTAIVEATEVYRSEMDPLGSFITACVERVPPVEGQTPAMVPAREMYDAYCAWCEANGAGRPWTEKTFGLTMPQKGIEKTEKTRIRQYLNVRLHDVPKVKRNDQPPHPADDVPLDDDDVVPVL